MKKIIGILTALTASIAFTTSCKTLSTIVMFANFEKYVDIETNYLTITPNEVSTFTNQTGFGIYSEKIHGTISTVEIIKKYFEDVYANYDLEKIAAEQDIVTASQIMKAKIQKLENSTNGYSIEVAHSNDKADVKVYIELDKVDGHTNVVMANTYDDKTEDDKDLSMYMSFKKNNFMQLYKFNDAYNYGTITKTDNYVEFSSVNISENTKQKYAGVTNDKFGAVTLDGASTLGFDKDGKSVENIESSLTTKLTNLFETASMKNLAFNDATINDASEYLQELLPAFLK